MPGPIMYNISLPHAPRSTRQPDLDFEVWKEAHRAAVDDNVSISDLTTSALRDYLEKRRRRVAAARNREAE